MSDGVTVVEVNYGKTFAWEFMVSRSVFIISKDVHSTPLVIRDVGGGLIVKSVTNDAEGVVDRLMTQGFLPFGRRLNYYDTEGNLDEIELEYTLLDLHGSYEVKFKGFVNKKSPFNKGK